MTCRGFRFEEGQTYELPDGEEAMLCANGFHACENPLDCFNYYPPAQSVYHEVELDASDETQKDDSKRVGNRIKIGAELTVASLCKAHFEFVKEHTTNSKQGNGNTNLSAQNRSSLAAQDRSSLAAQDGSSLAAQDGSSLAAQDRSSLAARDGSSLAARDGSSLAAQNRSSLAAQDGSSLAARDGSSLAAQSRSSLAAGKNSVLAAFNSKAKGGLNTLIALANRSFNDVGWKITDFKAAIVDGKTIKPDTWYKLQDGEFVECDEE